MRKKEITIKGVTYKVSHVENIGGSNCQLCDANDDELCEVANDQHCSNKYVWKIKPSDITVKSDVNGVKYDDDKLKYSLIPSYALEAVAQNLTDGLKKYPERDNWMKVDNAQERYLDALYRHLGAHRKGEVYDTDNINPNNTHLAAVIANAMFLLEFMLNPKLKGKND